MKITLFALNASYVHTCLALRALAEAVIKAAGNVLCTQYPDKYIADKAFCRKGTYI